MQFTKCLPSSWDDTLKSSAEAIQGRGSNFNCSVTRGKLVQMEMSKELLSSRKLHKIVRLITQISAKRVKKTSIGSLSLYLPNVSNCISTSLWDPDNGTRSEVLQTFGVGGIWDGQRRTSYRYGGDTWKDFGFQPLGIDSRGLELDSLTGLSPVMLQKGKFP